MEATKGGGGWGIPVTELRPSHKALLSLRESPPGHRQQRVGGRGQLAQLEAMPSVSWPFWPQSEGLDVLCAFFKL